jgi:predicted acetyltransferase
LEIRPLGPDDDLGAELDLRRRAFGPISAGRLPSWTKGLQASIDQGALVGAFDGRRLVGSARYHVMRQWWHGRSMPMAGVAGVKVAPEERGRGVGTAMMAAILELISERGFPVSVLFPSTAPLYRAGGWEIAGRRYETVLDARSAAALARPDQPGAGHAAEDAPKVRRATPADAAAIVEIEGLVHGQLLHCGPDTREPWMLSDWLDDEDRFAYFADDGFLSYRWSDDRDEIVVDELIAASAATARAWWQILASHATIASRIRACLPPDDPVTWLTRDPAAEILQTDIWMLRVVDAPAAIAARGYPAAAALSVHLDLADAARPANSGRWLLEVSAGAGSLTRLGDAPPALDRPVLDAPVPARPVLDAAVPSPPVPSPPVLDAPALDPPVSAPPAAAPAVLSLGARGFAALFAGVPVHTLRLAGLATGGDAATDDALGTAFCGPAFTQDRF